MSGGSSKQTSQLDPAMRDAFLTNVQGAQGVAGNLRAREFADFNPDQQAGFNIARQFADPRGETFTGMRSAFDVAGRAANYMPQQVQSRDPRAAMAEAAQLGRGSVRDVNAERIASQNVAGSDVARVGLQDIAAPARETIRDVNAGSMLDQNMQQYMSPYTQAVTQQGLADLNRSRQLQQQQNSAQAVAAKAFGGSRQGVAEAETNRAFDENAARFVGQQNANAFQSAQQAAQSDLARQMQAQQLNQAQDAAVTQQGLNLAGQFGISNQQSALDAARANQATNLQSKLANQGMDFNVGQLNTQNRQQTNLANQSAANQMTMQNANNFLQANLANQGAGLTANQQRLGAAGQMANISQAGQQMGFAGSQAMSNIGGQQQQFRQQQMDAIRNLPLEQQQIINQALGLNVGGGSGMQSSSSSRQGLLGLFGL